MQSPPPHPQAPVRSKTQRRRGPSTPSTATAGPFAGDSVVRATEDSLDALFAAEAAANFNQPWQRLDRGSRLDRLRRWVQCYPELTPAERASLLTAVLQAFELRQLNTKAVVEYDPASATVTAVRGLRERRNVAGQRVFRIDPAAATAIRSTQKRTVPAPAPAPAKVPPPPPPTEPSA
jgi:hypothetical protein